MKNMPYAKLVIGWLCLNLLNILGGTRSQLTSSPADGIHVAYAKGQGCLADPCTQPFDCIMQLDGVVATRPADGTGFYFATYSFPGFVRKEIKEFLTQNAGYADMMTTWINQIEDNTIIIGCSRDDATRNMNSNAWSALASIGMDITHQNYRSAHAMIGFKGAWPTNMRKSKSTSSGTAEVSYTYVVPPSNVIPYINGSKLEVTWQRVGTFFKHYLIKATNSLGEGDGNMNLTVDAQSETALFGPLKADTWFTITMQVSLETNSSQSIVPSNPYFVYFKNTLGCSSGIFQFVTKIDGNKQTFLYDQHIWSVNSILLPENNAFSGFDNLEAKPKAYNDYQIARICAGMKDPDTSQFSFIEFNLTNRRTMDQWRDSTSDFPSLPLSTWNIFSQPSVPTLNSICEQGLAVSGGGKKSRLGILGDSAGGCSDGDILMGLGLKYKGDASLSAGAIYESGGAKVVKPGFAYLLIPYLVDSQWSAWTSWIPCTVSCGTGTRFRARNSTRAIGDGNKLPPFENVTESCKIVDCKPPAPNNFAVTTVDKDKLKIKWDAVPAAEMTNTLAYYEFKEWKQGDSVVRTAKEYSNTEKTIYALEIFTVYCYQVYAVLSSNVAGNESETVCASTDESVPSDAPSGIQVFNSSAFCLNVTWTALPPAKARGIITKYRIYYKLEGGGAEQFEDSVSNSEQQICGLLPFTKYKIKMSGFTSKGEGPLSPYTSLVSTDEYIPSKAPVITSSRHTSSTSIEVEWQAIQLQFWMGLPLGYTIFYLLHDTYITTGSLYNVSYVDVVHTDLKVELTQLEKYRKYVIWACAYTVKGRGEQNSSTAEQMTDEDIPSRGPVVKAYNASSFSINAEWIALEIPYRLGQLTAYTIFYKNLKTGREDRISVGPSVTIKELVGLLPFLNHSVEVAASTSKGMGPRGPIAYTLTDEYVPSVGPPNFQGINISSYDLQLNWTRIPNEDWRGIPLGYTILYRETGMEIPWNQSVVHGEDTLATVITNLIAYTNYTIRIAGYTVKGNGSFTSDIIVTTAEDAPYMPPQNVIAAQVNSTFAIIQWQRPPEDQVKGIIRAYKIMYEPVYAPDDFLSKLRIRRRRRRAVISQSLDLNQKNITVGPNQFQITLLNLQGHTNYSVQIMAITLHEGPVSDWLYIFTGETVPAMSPLNVTAKATTYTALIVKWRHLLPAYAHGIISRYMVFYQHGNHSEATEFNDTQVPEREYLEITHLKIFAWYTIQVAAFTSVGIGVKSSPIHARTGEYIPSKAPENVTTESFVHPHGIDVTWLALPTQFWNGIPLGYTVTLTAYSVGGVPLAKDKVFSITKKVSGQSVNCSFSNLTSYFKYSLQMSAFTIVGDGPKSDLQFVETCKVSNSRLYSSWIQFSPLVQYNPLSSTPGGIIPKILSAALRHCSGLCKGLNVQSNSTIDYTLDGTGKPARKSSFEELSNTMTADTEFFFPVVKPLFPNENYQFIQLLSPESVVLVEGVPLVNTIGQNVSSALSGLLIIMVVFILFCFAAGCVMWAMETWYRTGQFRIASITGLLDGFYWGWVTATTVGYGDITPVSVLGKIFSMFWSIIGLILCGFLTGALSSMLTASEDPLAKPAPPKSGIGMVLDTWELAVAKKRGMSVDMNFTSYPELLDAVANGTIRYGILDAQVSKVWAAKLSKEKISVKKALQLGAELGVYASGNARQLFSCFETYVKEQQSSILKAMQAIVEKEAALVAKMLAVKENVTILVSPSKPEFYSWESQTMQAYLKAAFFTFFFFCFCGLIYELVRWFKRKKRREKVVPKQNRLALPRTDENSDYGSASFGDSEDRLGARNEAPNMQRSHASLRRPVMTSETEFEAKASKGNEMDISCSQLQRSCVSIRNAGLPKQVEDDEDISGSSQIARTSQSNLQRSRTSNRNEQYPESSEEPAKGLELTTFSHSDFHERGSAQQECDACPEEKIDLNTDDNDVNDQLFDSRSNERTTSFIGAQLSDEVHTIEESPDSASRVSPIPDDDVILSFAGCKYHDNDKIEAETEKLLTELEENFDKLVIDLTEKHAKELEKLLLLQMEFDKKLYGGTYKHYDPKLFAAPW